MLRFATRFHAWRPCAVAALLVIFAGTARGGVDGGCPPDGIVLGVHNTPPHSVQTDTVPTGLDIEVVEALMERLGCKLVFVQQPWARILDTMSKDGAIHMTTMASKLAERERFAWYSRSYIDLERLLFVRAADDTPYASLEDFFERRRYLGRVRGYSFGEAFDQVLQRYPDYVDDVNRLELNARKLAMGRIDGVVGEELQILDAFARTGLSDAVKSSGVEIAPKSGSYLIFSKSTISRAFVDRVDEALGAMIADGSLTELLAPYGARTPSR